MRSTTTRLGAVFVTLLLTVGVVAPAAADHSDPHTAWQAWEDAEAALDAVPNGNDHKDEREAAQGVVDESREAFDALDVEIVNKVTICHARGDVAEPYNSRPNVNPSAVITEGHGGHTGPVFDPTMTAPNTWGDIIPEFYFDQGNQVGYFPGLNWNDAGKAIWDADCVAATGEGDDDDGGHDPLPQDPPTVTVEDEAICADETDAIQVLLDNPTDADVTFLGTLSIDGDPVAAGNYLDDTVAAEDTYLFEGTAPAPATYTVTWQAFAADALLADGSFTITATDCSEPEPTTSPVLPLKAWFFEGLDVEIDEVPSGHATIELSFDDGEHSGSEQFHLEIGDLVLPVFDGPGELGDGMLSISLPTDDGDIAAPLVVPATIDLEDVTIEEVSYDVDGFTCTASFPDRGDVTGGQQGQIGTASTLDGPTDPMPWLLELDRDIQLLPVLNTCVADTDVEEDDVPVVRPRVYELEAAAEEVCLPDDLREVIALELDGRNVTSAEVELRDADGKTFDTIADLALDASPHQLDWPVDSEGERYAEVTLVVTSPQRPQLEVDPIVLTLDDVALEDCTEVRGVVDENPDPDPDPDPDPNPELQPQPEPQPVDEDEVDDVEVDEVDEVDEVEVRDVVLEREVPTARGQLPRTGASTVAIVLSGLLSLLTGGALLRSGRRAEDAS